MTDNTTFVQLTQGPVLEMILEDIRSIKGTQAHNQDENREEFRRVRDKIDRLQADVMRDFGVHDKSIGVMESRINRMAATTGAIAGVISSIVVGIAIAAVKFWLWPNIL